MNGFTTIHAFPEQVAYDCEGKNEHDDQSVPFLCILSWIGVRHCDVSQNPRHSNYQQQKYQLHDVLLGLPTKKVADFLTQAKQLCHHF